MWDISDVRFYIQLILCSCEDVSFNNICLNVMEGIKQLHLLMWFNENRLETPFNGNNVKASKCENLDLYFLKKVQQIEAFAVLFCFSGTKQLLDSGLGFPQWSEMPPVPARLKSNVTVARPWRLVIL